MSRFITVFILSIAAASLPACGENDPTGTELTIAERTPLGFTVALKDGDPNAEFSYRIVAKRLGFEGKRLEAAPWADHLMPAGGQDR